MLKKYVCLLLALSVGVFSGCAAFAIAPVYGGVYTDVKAPWSVTGQASSVKMGSSSAISILGIVATGDASIETAAKSAGITKIHHVDFESFSVLGVYAKFTVNVYGE